jgi:hypothetical protein
MLSKEQTAFIADRIHAIQKRIAKAETRVARNGNVSEVSRLARLKPILDQHIYFPEEAIKLYDKAPVVLPVVNPYSFTDETGTSTYTPRTDEGV